MARCLGGLGTQFRRRGGQDYKGAVADAAVNGIAEMFGMRTRIRSEFYRKYRSSDGQFHCTGLFGAHSSTRLD